MIEITRNAAKTTLKKAGLARGHGKLEEKSIRICLNNRVGITATKRRIASAEKLRFINRESSEARLVTVAKPKRHKNENPVEDSWAEIWNNMRTRNNVRIP